MIHAALEAPTEPPQILEPHAHHQEHRADKMWMRRHDVLECVPRDAENRQDDEDEPESCPINSRTDWQVVGRREVYPEANRDDARR
ncbi:hypothetical protein Sjap_017819 [Stephania japonica]|uniref:Uncharacterized protein n=1 Tax=Stephania japonica TaxID=461633 RepID=A0AAP0I6X4_9MAGN